jgi:hypothetical protein
MLYAFGFERVGVLVGDLYFLDPHPHKGQEGAEHGVRLELRVFGRGALKGSIYSAQPIEIGRPIWRADLLESVDGRPGSFDRTHHHPEFSGWDPNRRVFVRELSADPLGWLGGKLADLDGRSRLTRSSGNLIRGRAAGPAGRSASGEGRPRGAGRPSPYYRASPSGDARQAIGASRMSATGRRQSGCRLQP